MSRPQHYGSPTNFSPLERSATAESEEEAATMSTGSRPLSRNAQAQARLRARRKAYVESLEANVKRLQALVDALSVAPNRESHPLLDPSSLRTQLLSSSSSTPSISLSSPPQDVHGASTPQPTEDQCVRQLQLENGRLRRERDALRVQLDALVAYISRGGASSTEPSSNSGISSLSSYTAPTTQEAPNPSTQFVQGHPYADNELLPLRPLNALDLAALQAYLNLPGVSSQYSDFSATPTSASMNTALETSIGPVATGSRNPMGASVPSRRDGSSESSEGGAAYRR
ncbi:hypothetical protein FS749_012661 [Ceratobasidium sp. UAMH 11750]|nr:hypothetical protein FS749_012661 [Ceratobasidium sp. UAMH 11750]